MRTTRVRGAPQNDKPQQAVELDKLYGKIGISAVAAALGCGRDDQKPAGPATATDDPSNDDDVAA